MGTDQKKNDDRWNKEKITAKEKKRQANKEE